MCGNEHDQNDQLSVKSRQTLVTTYRSPDLNVCLVFENHKKMHLTLRAKRATFTFGVAKKLIKNAKRVIWASF